MESEVSDPKLLLSALQALDIESNKKDFEIRCEISKHGMKLLGHTKAFDVSCLCLLGPAIFKDYKLVEREGVVGGGGVDGSSGNQQQQRRRQESHDRTPLQRQGNQQQTYRQTPLQQNSQRRNEQGQRSQASRVASQSSQLPDNNAKRSSRSNPSSSVFDKERDDVRYQFGLPRSVLHDALKNHKGPTIKMHYDPDSRVFSIYGIS